MVLRPAALALPQAGGNTNPWAPPALLHLWDRAQDSILVPYQHSHGFGSENPTAAPNPCLSLTWHLGALGTHQSLMLLTLQTKVRETGVDQVDRAQAVDVSVCTSFSVLRVAVCPGLKGVAPDTSLPRAGPPQQTLLPSPTLEGLQWPLA